MAKQNCPWCILLSRTHIGSHHRTVLFSLTIWKRESSRMPYQCPLHHSVPHCFQTSQTLAWVALVMRFVWMSKYISLDTNIIWALSKVCSCVCASGCIIFSMLLLSVLSQTVLLLLCSLIHGWLHLVCPDGTGITSPQALLPLLLPPYWLLCLLHSPLLPAMHTLWTHIRPQTASMIHHNIMATLCTSVTTL